MRACPRNTDTRARDDECENAHAGPTLHSCVLECRDPYVYSVLFSGGFNLDSRPGQRGTGEDREMKRRLRKVN